MFIDVTDYHDHLIKLDPTKVIKLRPAVVEGEPARCTLIDFASGGLFAKGDLPEIRGLLSQYIRIAALAWPSHPCALGLVVERVGGGGRAQRVCAASSPE